jgi:hypothetical protein
MTATVLISSFFSGRNDGGVGPGAAGVLDALRLLSSVNEACATFSDSARCSSLLTTLIGIRSYGVSGSKAPRRKPTRRTLASALSTSDMVNRPRCTALGMLSSNS